MKKKGLSKLPKGKVVVADLLGTGTVNSICEKILKNAYDIEEIVIITTERGSGEINIDRMCDFSRTIYLLEWAKALMWSGHFGDEPGEDIEGPEEGENHA